MSGADFYRPGDWNAICDRCGRKFKASVMRKTWDGLYTCGPCWEPRHPQDFVKARQERPVPPWVRPPSQGYGYPPFTYPAPRLGQTQTPHTEPAVPPFLAKGASGGGAGVDAVSSVVGSSRLVYYGDVHFSNVLLLANGAGLTTDSSSYNRALSTGGSIALNNTYPLNGADTYHVPPSGGLFNGDQAVVCTLLGAGEWCAEFWLKIVAYSAFQRTICYYPCLYFNTGLSTGAATTGVDIGGFQTASVSSGVDIGAFKHIAIIRDNTTDASWTRIRLAINGTVVASSTGNIPKTTGVTQTTTQIMGFDSFSPEIAFGGYRLTRSTRRYLTNGEGAALNTFTPDQYPFLAY